MGRIIILLLIFKFKGILFKAEHKYYKESFGKCYFSIEPFAFCFNVFYFKID